MLQSLQLAAFRLVETLASPGAESATNEMNTRCAEPLLIAMKRFRFESRKIRTYDNSDHIVSKDH